MRKIMMVALVTGLFLALTALPALAGGGNSAESNGRPGPGPTVYVTSQGLYYDSIVLTDLPQKGKFQLLETGVGPTGLQTEFGPGDQGHRGGRWWVDVNGNGEQDGEDSYFLCPLLGPGRTTP